MALSQTGLFDSQSAVCESPELALYKVNILDLAQDFEQWRAFLPLHPDIRDCDKLLTNMIQTAYVRNTVATANGMIAGISIRL